MKKNRNNLQPHSGDKKQVQLTGSSFSGPIPPPQVLADYDKISPGFADRIISMAESEAKHRHTLEEKALKSQIIEIRLGQIFAFLIGSFTIAAGAFSAIRGAQIAGSIIGSGGVIGLVSVFIYGRKKQ